MDFPRSELTQVSVQQADANLGHRAEPFWQARYYDFNVWSERKFSEKLRYIHRNPVTRGLVDRPEHWPWSSFRHYLTGEHCGVEVESRWTARHENARKFPDRAQNRQEKPCPSGA